MWDGVKFDENAREKKQITKKEQSTLEEENGSCDLSAWRSASVFHQRGKLNIP